MAKEKITKRELMATGEIRKVIPQMAVPAIVAQLITTIYSLADTYFVSTLGTNATAAVGVNNSLERFISLFGMLIGAGASSYISRLLGSKKDEDAHQVMSSSLFTAIIFGALVTVFGLSFISPLVNFLGATQECQQYAIQYATYVLLVAPLMSGSYVLNMCLRSEGSATYAMIGMGFGGILNCFLDPLFIYVFGLGVAGASMATAISKVVSFVILITPYARKKTVAKVSLKYFRYKMEHVLEVLKIGTASFMRSLFGVIASVLLNRVAGGYSTSALAAFSVATRIMQFPFAIILGFGQGVQPVLGFNWGAKKYKRVKEGFTFASVTAALGGVCMGTFLFLLAEPVIRIFNTAANAEVLEYGALIIRLESIMLPVHAWGTIVNMFYAGIGKGKQALIGSTARQGYCFLPVLWLAPKLFGIYGVCGAQATADFLTLLVFIPMAVKGYHLLNDVIRQES